ncbi:uncharacterized protein LOC121428560 isoform X1 [Lytechinus variegatus]|uniref:uncharacterized protein LOC121428560 isoform X1 n=2 Tax=Lytechinus variegatus TaxID=7654 RepID=UPI001BB1B061|nr:uncharacterized protein LOC121428560 isoform X1 [Lytechinus variegatus]
MKAGSHKEKRNSGADVQMRMPSAKPPSSNSRDVRELSGRKEATGLMGRMRRTLKRGGTKSPKEDPAGQVLPGYQKNLGNGVVVNPSVGHGLSGDLQPSSRLDNDPDRISLNGRTSHCIYHNGCDIRNGNDVERRDTDMDHHCLVKHGRGNEHSNGRFSQNGSNGPLSDKDSSSNQSSYSGVSMFDKQGARPKTGLYRKKSSGVGKNFELGSVVLNVQANRCGNEGKGNNVDVKLSVGGLMGDESESDSIVPLQRKASVRNDISVNIVPSGGLPPNSDVTVNCSVNVHCHFTGMEEDSVEVEQNGAGSDTDSRTMQQNGIMSSAELEPLVIQMTHQPDIEPLNNPRTPHIAEVMMKDSLASLDSESSDRHHKSSSDSLHRESKTQRKGNSEQTANGDLNNKVAKDKLKKDKFEEVVLLPKDSQIVDVVTTQKNPACDESDMRFQYNLPRSVSDGAAILASYRSDESFKEKSMYGPAIDRRTKPKSGFGDYAQPEGSQDDDESPPPIPPRMSMVLDEESKKAEWETEPTHMCLPALMNGLYSDDGGTSASLRSKSLPRHSSLNDVSLDPSIPRRSKTAHLKNRVSQLFKTPRRKSCAFPDRPLPDVPGNKSIVQSRENRRSNIQRPQSLYCPTDGRNQIVPPPPARPSPQRPSAGPRLTPQRPGQENMVVIERREGFPTKDEVAKCQGMFASSLRRISECGWYWGPMSWDDAEMRLENTPDGSFLVRDSSDDRHILSLTFRVQGSTHHTRIEHHNGKFSFWSQPTTHGSSSIVEFIEEAMRHSRNGRFLYFLRPRWPGLPPVPLQLLYPISRFQKARSLQHMCRFVIRRHVRLDHIDALPLPRRLKEYLREGQYYTPDDIKP